MIERQLWGRAPANLELLTHGIRREWPRGTAEDRIYGPGYRAAVGSTKGQEWDAVFVLNVDDGCIPSDMAVGSPEQLAQLIKMRRVGRALVPSLHPRWHS